MGRLWHGPSRKAIMGPGASPAQFPVPRALMWAPSFKLPTATSPARRRRRRSVRLRKADRSAEYRTCQRRPAFEGRVIMLLNVDRLILFSTVD